MLVRDTRPAGKIAVFTTFWFPGYARKTMSVNVAWMGRGFNDCKMAHSIYSCTWNRFPLTQPLSPKVRHFITFLFPLGTPPGKIAVNVTWTKRGFNACQTHCSMYPSIFNRYSVIQPVSWKIRHFGTLFAHFGLPWVRLWDNRDKCHIVGKRIQCL